MVLTFVTIRYRAIPSDRNARREKEKKIKRDTRTMFKSQTKEATKIKGLNRIESIETHICMEVKGKKWEKSCTCSRLL